MTKESVKAAIANARTLPPEVISTVLNGSPEPFVLGDNDNLVHAINFRYCKQECDLFLSDPPLFKWVDQDRFFNSFQELQEAIND
jgi:hypothetical protein